MGERAQGGKRISRPVENDKSHFLILFLIVPSWIQLISFSQILQHLSLCIDEIKNNPQALLKTTKYKELADNANKAIKVIMAADAQSRDGKETFLGRRCAF